MKNLLLLPLLIFIVSCAGDNPIDPEPEETPEKSNCQDPYDLSFTADYMSWKDSLKTTTASYYQVQYGPQGFQLDEGTVFSTNNTYSSAFVLNKGNTYDAYVRTYCISDLGFSSWMGPVSTYADEDFNLCTAPVNLDYTINSESIDVSWIDLDGGDKTYETSMVMEDQAPETGTYKVVINMNTVRFTSLQNDVNYHFYIRTVCIDDTQSPWRGPLLVEN
jgi:hypothetical protein